MDEIVVNRDLTQLTSALAQDVIIDAPRNSGLPKDWPERAVPQTDGSVILTLEYPKALKMRDAEGKITAGDTYSSFHLKRLTGDHKIKMRSLKDEDFEATMLSFSTGIDLATTGILVRHLDGADLGSIMKVVTFFLKPGPLTGP